MDSDEGAEILRSVSFDVRQGEARRVGRRERRRQDDDSALFRAPSQNWTGSITLSGKSVRLFSRRQLAQKSPSSANLRLLRRLLRAANRRIWAPALPEAPRAPDRQRRRDRPRRARTRQRRTVRRKKTRDAERGRRQKILIAAAFAQEPDLLLLDEPTTFLDYPSRSGHRRRRRVAAQKAAAALEATHDLNRAALMVNRIVAGTGEVAYDEARQRSDLARRRPEDLRHELNFRLAPDLRRDDGSPEPHSPSRKRKEPTKSAETVPVHKKTLPPG